MWSLDTNNTNSANLQQQNITEIKFKMEYIFGFHSKTPISIDSVSESI